MRIARKRLTISLVLLASLLLPSVGLAQGTTVPNHDWSGLKTVTSGSKLVAKLKTGKSVEGRLTSVSDTALSLTVNGKSTDFSRDEILSVYQVNGKSATKATLIGMAVGAGAGAGIGAAIGAHETFVKSSAGAGILGVIGGGAGALIGFAIGKSGHKRVLIYQAK